MHTSLLLCAALVAQISVVFVPAEQAAGPLRILAQWAGADGGAPEAPTSPTPITTREEWSKLWQRLNRRAPRALNTAREMAIFISIGERPTGGFKPRALNAVVRDQRLVVVYADGKPSRDTMVTQAFTQPWLVLIVPKTALPIAVEQR